MKFPRLFHTSKTGALWQWDIETNGAEIITKYGQYNGAIQTASKLAEEKNVGRSNATTAAQQADIEALAMWKHRVERKYSETPDEAKEEVFLPMLAADYKKKKGKGIVFPCDVQPKLDGVRAMAFWDGDRIVLGTRGGKEWTAPTHIFRELEEIMPVNMVLDGELYIHNVDFESLTSWAKKQHRETPQLEYHIFDMPLSEDGENLPWSERLINLDDFFMDTKKKRSKVVMVDVICNVKSQQQLLELEEKYIGEGYEGAIARNQSAEYLFGHRSNHLQKIKSCVDAEYEVVGFTDGVGRDKGCVVWKCKTPEGKIFEARPKATLEKRAILFKNGNQYLGKKLKVVYQNLTKDGIPRFPRGIGFRDDIDM